MRTGNARTSVKPGRREETRSVGYAVRPRRLPPTLPPPDPGGAAGSNELGDLAAGGRYRLREQSGHGAAWPARCGAATLGPAHYDQPQTCLRGRTRISPATSRILLGALAWKSASGEAHRRHRAGRRTRSWRGAPQRRRAGPASLIEQNQPTGVTTRCGLRCSGSGSTTVACLCISSNSSVQGSARIAPACHRSVVLQA